MPQLKISFQLVDAATEKSIIVAGGFAVVCTVDTADKATLLTEAGAAADNGQALTRGHFEAWIDDAVNSVDIYGLAPNGEPFRILDYVPGQGPTQLKIKTGPGGYLAQIPFSHADQAGDATETDTGFDLPAKAAVFGDTGGTFLDIIDIDATETIDFGTLSTESGGDANGLGAAVAVDTLGLIANTDGALIAADVPAMTDTNTAKSISYTLSAGADTAAGFINLAYHLA